MQLVASGGYWSYSTVEADITVALGEEALAARVCEEGSSPKESLRLMSDLLV